MFEPVPRAAAKAAFNDVSCPMAKYLKMLDEYEPLLPMKSKPASISCNYPRCRAWC